MNPSPIPVSPPAALTAEDFTRQYAHRYAELVKGVVKEYPVPFVRHGTMCATVAALLWNYVTGADLGRISTNDSWVRTGRDPDTVRGADVCFFTYDRLPKGPVPEGLLSAAPDLVVEVRSPSDRWTSVFAKVAEYLEAGVRVVVILDPATASASVYRPDEVQQIFHNGDDLVVPDVLPGFAVAVQRLFT